MLKRPILILVMMLWAYPVMAENGKSANQPGATAAAGRYCDQSKASLVELEFPEQQVFFKPKPNESADMNKKFADKLSRCKGMEFILVPRSRMAELKSCASRMIIPAIDSYKLTMDGPGQKKGTIKMTLQLFGSGGADTPEKSVTATATGASWFGKNKPLELALIETAEALCDNKSW